MGSHSTLRGAPAGPAVVQRFERPLRIRFSHCDPAGIVFFPQYMVMFNGLLEDWFTDGMGIPYGALVAQRRIGTPTVSLQCDFTAISSMGDDVTLGLTVLRIGGASFRLSIGCRQGTQERVRMDAGAGHGPTCARTAPSPCPMTFVTRWPPTWTHPWPHQGPRRDRWRLTTCKSFFPPAGRARAAIPMVWPPPAAWCSWPA